MADALLDRISTVCNYYRGGSWTLQFDSEDGGYWGLQLRSPAEEGHEDPPPVPTLLGMMSQTTPNYPIFAMRCQELTVIAEALEHWHSSVLSRDVPQ